MIREELWELRRLRLRAVERFSIAADLLEKACRGMGTHRAVEVSGTRDAPITAFTLDYSCMREKAEHDRKAADTLWITIVAPELEKLHDLDARAVFGMYYNCAMSWENVRKAVKRGEASIWRMHREGLRELENLRL